MNLKLKRLVRTPNSEQYALFDLDQVDENQDPQAIGKLDLHYTGEGTYGTVLLWDDVSRQMESDRRQAFLRALLDEIAQPMGVPSEYVVEYFAPSLNDYEMLHNVGGDDDLEPYDLEAYELEAYELEAYEESDMLAYDERADLSKMDQETG
jgi:hypothetical protein